MIFKNGKKVTDIYVNGKPVVRMLSGGHIVYQKVSPTPTTIGEFTVNYNGGKVTFASGNLQYQASTSLWRFAEHQWDFVGGFTYGNVYEGGVKCDNSLISSSYSGWIDLFGYGTSGYNNGQNAFEPYSASSTNSDYYSQSLNGTTADWGYAYGQQHGGTWRTLTKNEWNYIINTRVGNRYTKCQIGSSINALIIFPDNYTTSLANVNTGNAAFTSNLLTIQDAENLTNDGCVILPAGSLRNGYTVNYTNLAGHYRSSTPNSSGAVILDFDSGSISATSNAYRLHGFSVRLVQDIL